MIEGRKPSEPVAAKQRHGEQGEPMAKKKKPVNQSNWTDAAVETFARCVWPDIVAFFESEEGQREFAQWQREQAMKAERNNGSPNEAA